MRHGSVSPQQIKITGSVSSVGALEPQWIYTSYGSGLVWASRTKLKLSQIINKEFLWGLVS